MVAVSGSSGEGWEWRLLALLFQGQVKAGWYYWFLILAVIVIWLPVCVFMQFMAPHYELNIRHEGLDLHNVPSTMIKHHHNHQQWSIQKQPNATIMKVGYEDESLMHTLRFTHESLAHDYTASLFISTPFINRYFAMQLQYIETLTRTKQFNCKFNFYVNLTKNQSSEHMTVINVADHLYADVIPLVVMFLLTIPMFSLGQEIIEQRSIKQTELLRSHGAPTFVVSMSWVYHTITELAILSFVIGGLIYPSRWMKLSLATFIYGIQLIPVVLLCCDIFGRSGLRVFSIYIFINLVPLLQLTKWKPMCDSWTDLFIPLMCNALMYSLNFSVIMIEDYDSDAINVLGRCTPNVILGNMLLLNISIFLMFLSVFVQHALPLYIAENDDSNSFYDQMVDVVGFAEDLQNHVGHVPESTTRTCNDTSISIFTVHLADHLSDFHLTVISGCITVILMDNQQTSASIISVLSGSHTLHYGMTIVFGQGTNVPSSLFLCPCPFPLLEEKDVYYNFEIFCASRSLSCRAPFLDSYLRKLKVEDCGSRPFSSLPYSESRRCLLAIALSVDTSVLMIQQPTEGLSGKALALVEGLLHEEMNRTIVVLTSNPDTAEGLAEQLAIVDTGTTLCQGPRQRIREKFSTYVITVFKERTYLATNAILNRLTPLNINPYVTCNDAFQLKINIRCTSDDELTVLISTLKKMGSSFIPSFTITDMTLRQLMYTVNNLRYGKEVLAEGQKLIKQSASQATACHIFAPEPRQRNTMSYMRILAGIILEQQIDPHVLRSNLVLMLFICIVWALEQTLPPQVSKASYSRSFRITSVRTCSPQKFRTSLKWWVPRVRINNTCSRFRDGVCVNVNRTFNHGLVNYNFNMSSSITRIHELYSLATHYLREHIRMHFPTNISVIMPIIQRTKESEAALNVHQTIQYSGLRLNILLSLLASLCVSIAIEELTKADPYHADKDIHQSGLGSIPIYSAVFSSSYLVEIVRKYIVVWFLGILVPGLPELSYSLISLTIVNTATNVMLWTRILSEYIPKVKMVSQVLFTCSALQGLCSRVLSNYLDSSAAMIIENGLFLAPVDSTWQLLSWYLWRNNEFSRTCRVLYSSHCTKRPWSARQCCQQQCALYDKMCFAFHHTFTYKQGVVFAYVAGITGIFINLIMMYLLEITGRPSGKKSIKQEKAENTMLHVIDIMSNKAAPKKDANTLKEEARINKLTDAKLTTMKGLVVKGVSRVFMENIAILNANFYLEASESLALLGVKESGCSTMCRLLSCRLKSTKGVIYFDGKNLVPGMDPYFIGYCAQESVVPPNLTVASYLQLVSASRKQWDNLCFRNIKFLAEVFRVTTVLNQPFRSLEPGVSRTVQVMAAFINDPSLVVIDDPTSDSNIQSSLNICNGIAMLISQGATVVISTGDIEICERIGVRRVAVLVNGEITRLSTLDDMLSQAMSYIISVRLSRGVQDPDREAADTALQNYLLALFPGANVFRPFRTLLKLELAERRIDHQLIIDLRRKLCSRYSFVVEVHICEADSTTKVKILTQRIRDKKE